MITRTRVMNSNWGFVGLMFWFCSAQESLLKHELCPRVAAFVTPVCILWEQLSPIVSGFPNGAPDVGLADQCGRCAGANFSGCWFSMGSKFCCCSTTIKPLGNRAALPASSFTRSCSCIIEVTELKAAARSLLLLWLYMSGSSVWLMYEQSGYILENRWFYCSKYKWQ